MPLFNMPVFFPFLSPDGAGDGGMTGAVSSVTLLVTMAEQNKTGECQNITTKAILLENNSRGLAIIIKISFVNLCYLRIHSI